MTFFTDLLSLTEMAAFGIIYMQNECFNHQSTGGRLWRGSRGRRPGSCFAPRPRAASPPQALLQETESK